jgi:hypothetical protein
MSSLPRYASQPLCILLVTLLESAYFARNTPGKDLKIESLQVVDSCAARLSAATAFTIEAIFPETIILYWIIRHMIHRGIRFLKPL